MAKKQEVSKIEETQLPTTFDVGSDLEAYAAANDVKDIESDEIITPRINVLQSMSKQVKKSQPEYIKGAEEGMFINGATGKLYGGDTGFYFIPCYNERVFNEWIPQSLGGGLVKRWGKDESFKNQNYVEEKGRWQKLELDDKSGKMVVKSEVIKTSDYFVLVVDKETGQYYPAVLGFSGTKYKVHRKLINDISLADYTTSTGKVITPPPFYRVYHAITVPESDGTNSWFNIKWSRAGNTTELKNSEEIWAAAKEFRKMVLEGKAVAEQEVQETHSTVVNNDDDTTI